MVAILQFFNIVDISEFRQLSRWFNTHIERTNKQYHYISNSNDNQHRKRVPNLALFRLLYKFKGV